MRLAPTVDRAIRRARAEVSRLLQALEVIQDRLGDGCPVRPGNVFNENNFSCLVLRYAPRPGVRNDGSNHPGESLAPIEVPSDKFEDALLNQSVDFIKRLHYGSAISPNTILLTIGR